MKNYSGILYIFFVALSSCYENNTNTDFKQGVNYNYSNGVLKYLYIVDGKNFGKNYYFYFDGMIRSISDSSGLYWIYNPSGQLVNHMQYKLMPDRSHYYKYFTLDSSCQLEIYNNKKILKIFNKNIQFNDTNRLSIGPTDYSLIINNDSLEIHACSVFLSDIKINSYYIK